MNESFRVGAALLLKTLYTNVALDKYHRVSKENILDSNTLNSLYLPLQTSADLSVRTRIAVVIGSGDCPCTTLCA